MKRDILLSRGKTRSLVFTALFTVLGILIPFLTSHVFGVPGTVLLPMHLPVFLCSLSCGPLWGALCGFITPLLSSLMTGMPPAFPMLPIMLCELTVYGLAGGLLYRKARLPLLVALPLAMIAGRVAYGLCFAAVTQIAGGQIQALSVTAAFIAGLPGIAIQLILTPLVIKLMQRAGLCLDPREQHIARRECEARDEAVRMIENGQASCVLIKNGAIIRAEDGRGVKPLLGYLDGDPEALKDALLVDRIIGRAAAMLAVLGGVKSVHALTVSRGGLEYLEARGIQTTFESRIDMISNRTGDGICPLERSVQGIDDPKEGLAALRVTIAELMRNKA